MSDFIGLHCEMENLTTNSSKVDKYRETEWTLYSLGFTVDVVVVASATLGVVSLIIATRPTEMLRCVQIHIQNSKSFLGFLFPILYGIFVQTLFICKKSTQGIIETEALKGFTCLTHFPPTFINFFPKM